MNYDAIGAAVARDIFQLGVSETDLVQRIEFKGGCYPDAETRLGGLCEVALAGHIADSLRRHMTAPQEDQR